MQRDGRVCDGALVELDGLDGLRVDGLRVDGLRVGFLVGVLLGDLVVRVGALVGFLVVGL